MNYFKQIYFEMKHQKMMTWVSISGTALAIFLVMVFVMGEQMYTVEAAPESNRSRILCGEGVHIICGEGDASGMGTSYDFARRAYEDLDGVEMMSYISSSNGGKIDVCVRDQEVLSMIMLQADGNIWKIYDYKFVEGRPFSIAEAEANARVVVISRSAARRLFGTENVSGREIDLASKPYTIIGVVEDVKSILPQSYAEIIKPFKADEEQNDNFYNEFYRLYFGDVNVLLLIKDGVDPADIKRQVRERYVKLHQEAQKEGLQLIYHKQPYTAKEKAVGNYGSNTEPEMESRNLQTAILFALLIILPAINLSSMTRSRLRHRVTEIGVRRAFGAKRRSIVMQILGENFIMTLIGGCIGLILSFIFQLYFSDMIFSYTDILDSYDVMDARPDFSMLFRWSNFFAALLLCFVLNLLSATVPAWKASKVEPAAALSASR